MCSAARQSPRGGKMAPICNRQYQREGRHSHAVYKLLYMQCCDDDSDQCLPHLLLVIPYILIARIHLDLIATCACLIYCR